jgi:hypothetical protein
MVLTLLCTYGIYAPPFFRITIYILEENLLETLFVLSFNHQNPQSGFIALTDLIPRLAHFQGFVEQEGKGRGGHTCSLPEKDTTKT